MNPGMLASAWLMGFLGSTHCVVMCGGVVAMTCSALPVARRTGASAHLPYALAYNGGRIASYGFAGAIAGTLGGAFAAIGFVERAQLGLRLLAAVMMIAVGLYVTGFARGLRWIERIGGASLEAGGAFGASSRPRRFIAQSAGIRAPMGLATVRSRVCRACGGRRDGLALGRSGDHGGLRGRYATDARGHGLGCLVHRGRGSRPAGEGRGGPRDRGVRFPPDGPCGARVGRAWDHSGQCRCAAPVTHFGDEHSGCQRKRGADSEPDAAATRAAGSSFEA